MLLLLPPSETKRDGGDVVPLDLGALAHPELTGRREHLLARVVALAGDADATIRALKLGPRQGAEVQRNLRLREAPTMAAIDRYTGVLFDALDASSLDDGDRSFAANTLMIHSALFGLVAASDPIPAYRLSHDSQVPDVRLRRLWRSALSDRLAERSGVIVDLRSEAYAELGPAPVRPDCVFVRVVSDSADGHRRALNHFNKQAKGRFARAFLKDRPEITTIDDLIAWASVSGFWTRRRESGSRDSPAELELVA